MKTYKFLVNVEVFLDAENLSEAKEKMREALNDDNGEICYRTISIKRMKLDNMFKADFIKIVPYMDKTEYIKGFQIRATNEEEARNQIRIWFDVVSPITIYK